MEQTWFDLPVESRLTEVWPKGLLKKSKMITHACKPAEMSFPMPYWNLPVVPMDQKMPLLPGPKDLYHLARSKLGEKLWGCEDSEFSLNEFIQKEIFNAYEILHDPNLAHFLRRPKIVRRLKELGLVDSQLGVMCNLRDYNYYRRYLAFVHNNAINKLYKEQFSKGDNNLEVAALTVNLEKQNAKARVDEEIEQRHAEVFKEISVEKKKKDAVCQKRLRRVEEVFQRKQSNREARRIAAREAAKDFTRKVKENLYYANAQLRQHKLDTMRKWRKQNTEKTALFEEMKKKKQEDLVNKKTEWFQNKIKHQEKRVLQETQINVLMDHEFSPEYKRYLKYIKRENYKNPPAQTAGPEYRVSSESEVEDTDLLNQLRLFTKAGYQLQRGSFISRVQARQSVAKLANLTSKAGSYAQVRRMSEKFMKEKQNMKNKKKQSVLDALINSSILRLLSPSLQDVFKKSDSKWKNRKQKAGKIDKVETSAPLRHPSAASGKLPTLFEVVNVDAGEPENVTTKTPEESLKDEDEDEEVEGGAIGLGRDSEIEIRPPNKTIPPPPICHLNVYRYFDRVLGKVILEYVTRILLPKFPEIINRCHWVSKAEGLPEDSDINKEKPPCHPDDSRQSYTECMELMKDSCDKKMACYLLLYSESPDIRLFRHKFNGIGEITCPESLVGNFLVQSSPHPQHILDYIHWRADWILNYPPPKTYQEIYDLKHVIGVMKNIECPVFQPIYKLWEITNDINLNPEVLDKFVLHMEKKKEQKPTVELNPVQIAVKNVRKIIGPLTMDYKVTKEVDDYCLKDLFKVPSELFRMSYLKKPVDPRIWKILDELLDKTRRRPEDLECLRCLPDKFKQKLSQIEDYDEIEQTAAESLFIDSKDYTEELKKAKDKDKDETTDSPHIRFGMTEFIPYVEAQLFGKEKGYYVAPEAEEDSLDKGGKDKNKKKKPSILRFSFSSREKRKSSRSQKRDSSRGSRISHQKKETNLAAKMQSPSVEGRRSLSERRKSLQEKEDAQKRSGKAEPTQEKEKSAASKEPKVNAEQVEEKEEDEGSDVTVETKHEAEVETSKAVQKAKSGKPEKTSKSAKPSSKDGKDKKKKGKDKKPDKSPKSTAEEKTEPTPVDNEAEETEDSQELKRERGVQESKIKFKVADEEKKQRENQEITAEADKETVFRTKSLSIMKSPDVTSSLKTDLNVKFTSKKYVEPHIFKTLDVMDDLKKSKDRAPTPHPSFTSIQEEMQIPKKLLEEAQKHQELSNILKYKECTKAPESDENVLTEVPLFPRRPSDINIRV